MEERERSKVLICTVGWSNNPVIKSIDYWQPEYVLFIPSEDTENKVEEIRRKLAHIQMESAVETVRDADDIIGCVGEMREFIKKFLARKKIQSDVVIDADFTGGTKVMSAALALVMMELDRCRFSYVGGDQRDPAQRMAVVDGKEKVIHRDNPWKAMGVTDCRRLVNAFNSRQFGFALQAAKDLMGSRDDARQFYSALVSIIEAFANWDLFEYKKALKSLATGCSNLRQFGAYYLVKTLYDRLSNYQTILERIVQDADILRSSKVALPLPREIGGAYLRDLLANAGRCAIYGRYDDAVARLYSAIEKIAKLELAHLGKNNSSLSLSDLREGGEDFEAKHAASITEEKGAEIGLEESFRYLRAIAPGNPVAGAYFANEKSLKQNTHARNMSLLAHGYNPVDKKTYEAFMEVTLQMAGIQENELTKFPKLELKDVLI